VAKRGGSQEAIARRRLEQDRLLRAQKRTARPSAQEPPRAFRTPASEPLHDGPQYLTTEEGARLLRFDATAPASAVVSFRQWLRREGVPVLRRGRVLLVERRELEAALRRDRQ
jgi:hypothetical protein